MPEEITIIKNNHLGEEVWRYQGKQLSRSSRGILFEAFFNRTDLKFNGILLKNKDLFLELYLFGKYYNIYEIHDRDSGQLKAWYCNVTRPVKLADGSLSYDDLALDLLVFPDGHQLVLDEDEFEPLPLSDDERRCALDGLKELQDLFVREHPLDIYKML